MTTYTDILLQDTSNNYFIPYGLIDRLGDVDISNPTTGQNLTYDATSGKWKNTSTTATVAWGGITGTLSDQTDLTNALNGKQDTLVSGTNIKTINSTSLLGSGDISVGTVTSVNNVSPVSGNVTLLIPTQASDISAADTTLSNVLSIDSNSAVQTALDGKVAKSGDTMTGELIIERNASPNIKTRHTDFVKGTTPSEYLYWEFRPEDGNTNPSTWYENRVGNFVTQIDTNGTIMSQMVAMKNDPNTNAGASVWVQMTQAGVASCGFPNTTCCDGQWVRSYQSVIPSATSLNGSSNLPYTISLPNDGHNYEVLFLAEGRTGNASGNHIVIKLCSDILPDGCTVARTRTRTTSTVECGGNIILPVSTSHNIYVPRATNLNGELTALVVLGYRRIGTNS